MFVFGLDLRGSVQSTIKRTEIGNENEITIKTASAVKYYLKGDVLSIVNLLSAVLLCLIVSLLNSSFYLMESDCIICFDIPTIFHPYRCEFNLRPLDPHKNLVACGIRFFDRFWFLYGDKSPHIEPDGCVFQGVTFCNSQSCCSSHF